MKKTETFEEFYGQRLSGFARSWKSCRECARVYAYDYQPYSIANPIRWTRCGHSIGYRDLNCNDITKTEARRLFAKDRRSKPRKVKRTRKSKKSKARD